MQEKLIAGLHAGAAIDSLCEEIYKHVDSTRPDLRAHLTKVLPRFAYTSLYRPVAIVFVVISSHLTSVRILGLPRAFPFANLRSR